MIEIIKEKCTPTVGYHLKFVYVDDPDSGFYFPATSSGEPDYEKMIPEARANYETCLSDKQLNGPEFITDEYTKVASVIGLCSCGREVELDADADFPGAFHCDCGRWYNLFGYNLRNFEYEKDSHKAD